jgi:hypothetical protein
MTMQEDIKAKNQKMKALAENIRNLRKTNPLQYDKDEYTLQEQYGVLHQQRRTLHRKLYLESLNCKVCEDSGWAMHCCSDEGCGSNIPCYDCDLYTNEIEEENLDNG